MGESLFTKILVPVDFSPCSEEAFRVALVMARTFQAKLLLLYVIDTSVLAAFNQLGLLAVPSAAQRQKRRLRIMRDSMFGDGSNPSRPKA